MPLGLAPNGYRRGVADSLSPLSERLGYTTSEAIYLPAAAAEGLTLTVVSGTASVYAGTPGAAFHQHLATLNAGQSYELTGLGGDDVVSVQGGAPFSYEYSEAEPEPEPEVGLPSAEVSWTCTGSSCPWGSQLTGRALPWPATLSPQSERLGYTTSQPVYLPAAAASGMTLTLLSGSASVYAGAPDAPSHRHLAALSPGGSYK